MCKIFSVRKSGTSTMAVYTITLLAHFVITMAASAEPGQTDLNARWSYQWYPDEAFYMYCNSSKLNVQAGDHIEWETPSGKMLKEGLNDNDYKLSERLGVESVELEIKHIHTQLEGIYICSIYNNTSVRAKQLIGLNLHDHKYHSLGDKYQHNVIVAVVAMVVFLVPVLTSCIVYECRYQTAEHRETSRLRRQIHYTSDQIQMKEPIANRKNVGGDNDEAYQNINFQADNSTKL